MKKTSFLFLIIGLVFLGQYIFSKKQAIAQTSVQRVCPAQTTYGNTWATLVGEIQDNGGDPNITAWFEWGTSSFSLTNRTPDQFLFIPNPPQGFCQTITGLQPCTTYFYRAVARNSAGTSRGSIYSFTTQCAPLQVSCSASPNPANVNQTVIFTANVSGGNGSYSYSWSGACSGSSSTCSRSFSSAGTYTANITVTSGNETKSASCSVTVNQPVRPPAVITLPPVITL
ncbi:MAG: hypothetical protein KatS3mg096_482 [Candidatus Parcubacteria bacterium]|nr:MAG: hypothetical protein KatS3mg096_482 [Candidatus Parcubacteria bacterium]